MLPLRIRKRRNEQVTKMLKEECGITVVEKTINDLKNNECGFKIIGNHTIVTISRDNPFFEE